MKWIKQLFCNHKYEQYTKQSLFTALNGERIYTVCSKCGKHNGSYFHET